MFQLTYMRRELRRRLGRTILTALGLAAGVGLVIGIMGVSQGLNEAQAEVLAPLESVGTDILVTRVAGTTTTASPAPTPSASTGPVPAGPGGGFFRAGGPGAGNAVALNDEDTAALLNENSSVITDLSKLGKPGEKFTHDFFLSATLLSFPDEAVAQISALDGVTEAAAALTQLAQHQTGTVPQIVGRPLDVRPVDLALVASDAVADARAVQPDRPIDLVAGDSVVVEGDERVDRSRSRGHGGSGLGLSIVEATIKAHHGRVGLETSPGDGARFVVELPLATSETKAGRAVHG